MLNTSADAALANKDVNAEIAQAARAFRMMDMLFSSSRT